MYILLVCPLFFYWVVGEHYVRPIVLIAAVCFLALIIYSRLYAMLAWLVASPLVNWLDFRNLSPESYNAITLREIFDFDRTIIVIIFIFVMFDSLNGNFKRKKNKSGRVTSSILLLYAGYLMINILVLSYNKAHGLKVAFDSFVVPLLVFILAWRLIDNQSDFRMFRKACLTVVFYLIALSAFEMIHAGSVFRRLTWPFPFWETYGFVMSILFLVVMYHRLALPIEGEEREPVGLVFVLMILGVFCTLTRAVWISFLVAAIIFYFQSKPFSSDRFYGKIIISIGGVLLAVTLFWIVVPDVVTKTELYQRRVAYSSTLENRFETYTFAFSEMAKHPVMGIGFRNFREYYGVHGPERNNYTKSNPGKSTIHNSYINIWVEQGAVGLGLFLGVLFMFYRNVRNAALREAPSLALWGRAGYGMLVIYLLSGVAYDPLFDPPFFFNKMFFFIMGIYCSSAVTG